MGIIPFDLLYNVSTYPQAGQKIDARSLFMQGGGPVPNVMIGLSRMGFKTALIATVGNDPFGQLLIEELKSENVDHRYIIIKNKPTALATGWIENGSGRRTMVLSREVIVEASDIKVSMLPLPRIIHLDGRDMPATMKIARWAKRKSITVSFDIGSVRNDVSSVFPYVDHLVVADEYAFPFTKTKNIKKSLSKLQKLCPGTVVITEGIKGSSGLEPNSKEIIFQPAFKVKNVDTTGAGDCYHTGYLYGLLNGYGLQERMRFGSASAALKCTKPGARTGIPSDQKVFSFLKNNPDIY